jgi:hypothetical protein
VQCQSFFLEVIFQYNMLYSYGASMLTFCIGGSASTGGLHLVPPAADSINRDGRQNKKSKWDKVFISKQNVNATSVILISHHCAY